MGPSSHACNVHHPAVNITSLLGDKDGFGMGLVDGDERPVSLGFFDNRGLGDPVFTDVEPVPADFTYNHQLDLPPHPLILSATVSLLTLGVQDGDNQVVGSDTDIRLFVDGVEVPHAFDDVDQFSFNGSEFVEEVGLVDIAMPRPLIRHFLDGNAQVRLQILQLGTASSTDAIAIDYSELTVLACGH
jgi:hypothetical protein